ncbi:MAG TPA: glutamate 5-kinase [Tepidisphaeraceae bacterium]|jgi:glutamate 5-kinase
MRESLKSTRSLVVKLGSAVLSDQARRLDTAYIASVAKQIKTLTDAGVAVTVVSSGAVSAGMAELNLPKRPADLATLQAVAAVGQRRLMDAWAEAFAPHALHAAQVLLTREDIDARKRFLNLRNTIHALHELGAVPVVNENDTISTDEIVRISFGDNDILAASVAVALRADVLVILSNVDGVLDADGNTVATIESADTAADLVRIEKSAAGKGGMASKFEAARMVTRAGECLVVAHGRTPDVLLRVIEGQDLGTLFLPRRTGRTRSRARWIGAARPHGRVTVDEGAARAIVERDVSLLPAGIIDVDGEFEKGDVIQIQRVLPDAHMPIAHGLTNYSATDLRAIQGKRSAEVRTLLGDRAYDEVVHRDNLVKLGP